MDIKNALEKEIEFLDAEIRRSYEFAQKRGDISIGHQWRGATFETIASYKRIISSLTE
jgi:hypothetical protein